jgi:hypothetical protein
LSGDWIHGEDILVEVLLSPNQFAEFITSPNMGDGVPCTIRFAEGKTAPPCPNRSQRELFEEEFKEHLEDIVSKTSQIVNDVKNLFDTKSNITKGDRAAILSKLNGLQQDVESNLPFIHSQFNEAMDKTVTEAKAEVEAFVEGKIRSLGLEALNTEIGRSLTTTVESPVFQLTDGRDKHE